MIVFKVFIVESSVEKDLVRLKFSESWRTKRMSRTCFISRLFWLWSHLRLLHIHISLFCFPAFPYVPSLPRDISTDAFLASAYLSIKGALGQLCSPLKLEKEDEQSEVHAISKISDFFRNFLIIVNFGFFFAGC